ncbi:hypothetical protein Tsubulata_016813 [Turnera subulata]|uniref:Uncharacterized protein n=1 Tax=Turnera subulata TaxID=218843 RepID=A0A9Q0F555_9ROSI|nr:hypothetical protein Tsubulata_016813 [Turnera subulata]
MLRTNWQEPCIIFCPHWSLRLGPVVHLLRKWRGDPNSLLVLEDGLDTEMALLPFKPIVMKVLQCSFLSGIRSQKAQSLFKILRPKVLLVPEDLKQRIKISSSSSNPFSVLYYSENETLDLPSLQCGSHIEIAADLATRFGWRSLKQDGRSITRLGGQLLVDRGKCQLLSGTKVAESLQSGPLLYWGFPDIDRLLTELSKMGIKGTKEQKTSDSECGITWIIDVHDPGKALIEIGERSTVIFAPDEHLAALIFAALGKLLDGI